ncbi:MAG: TonB family protein [Polyangiaceae bacterium]
MALGLGSAWLLCAATAIAQGEVTTPVPRNHPEALYPESERANAPELVIVTLVVTIDQQGHVVEAKSEELAPGVSSAFAEAATLAVRKWEFVPAYRNGEPIASRIKVPFHFHKPVPPPAPAPKPTAAPEAKPAPEDVSVRGRPTPPSRGPSDFQIHVGELERVPRQNASDLLKLAPGIMLTNEGGDGHAEQVFLRGFDAREGQDIEFSVNGVPINESGNLHANGYADTHFILPELVSSLRVLEGPFDPRQGNYAVAGSADYQLGLKRRGFTSKLTAGSFNTQRLVLLWGPKDESERTFGGAEIYRTDGFGQNRGAKRATAMAQYEGKIGKEGTYRVLATAYGSDYQSAGLLRNDDVTRGTKGFYDTYDPRQGGQSTRFSLAGDIHTKSGATDLYEQLFVTLRGMRVQENFTGFLLDVQEPVQRPHGQRGDLIDRDIQSITVGSRGWARMHHGEGQKRHELEFGYFARMDSTNSTQYRVAAQTNAPYALDISNESKLADIGLYADGLVRPLPKFALKGGVRADLFAFDILNACAVKAVRRPNAENPPGDASCLSQGDFGAYREPTQRATTSSVAITPKATATFGPFSGVNFALAYGQGIRSIDPIYVYEDVNTPFARVESYEGGVTYARALRGPIGRVTLVAKSIFFGTHVDRDLVFSQSEGRNTLANGTTRTGWSGALRLTGAWLDQAANLTLVRSTFDDTGLLVPYVPDTVLRSDTVAHAKLPVRIDGTAVEGALGAGISFVGRRSLPFGERSNTIFTLDTSASLAWRGFEVALSSTNLTGSQYRQGEYNFASNWNASAERPSLVPARHFTAGAPRAFFATLTITVGGADK